MQLAHYVSRTLGQLAHGQGGYLEWRGKGLAVYMDFQGFYWMNSMGFHLSDAEQYARLTLDA